MSEPINILKKSLESIKGAIIRVGEEAKILESDLHKKLEEGQQLVSRKEELEKAIAKLEKQDEPASKSKKTKS